MTGCLNGGSCLLDKKRETFACSCKLPWSGKRCEVKLSEPLLCFQVFCFIISNSIFFSWKKKSFCFTSSVWHWFYFLYLLPSSRVDPFATLPYMAASLEYVPGEYLNFSPFVLNRVLELSGKCFKRTRKHLASDVFGTKEFKTPRQRRERERQKGSRLNRQNNNSLFCSFRSIFLCRQWMHDYDELLYDVRRKIILYLSKLGCGSW